MTAIGTISTDSVCFTTNCQTKEGCRGDSLIAQHTPPTSQVGISLITLIITIIVIIILAAIVIFTGLNTPDRANFAKFTQEFADFQTAVTQDFFNRKAQYSLEGKQVSDEQIYYMIASNSELEMNQNPIKVGAVTDLGTISPTGFTGTEIYEITNDPNVAGWKQNKKWYDQSNEKHYVTDKGEVFMLPGYKVIDGNEIRWYINSSKYYTGETLKTLMKTDLFNDEKSETEETREPGIYNADTDELIVSWADLKNEEKMNKLYDEKEIQAGISVEDGEMYSCYYYDCNDDDLKINVVISNEVTYLYIGEWSENIVGLYIPESVTYIDASDSELDNLEKIIINDNNSVYDSRENCNAIVETSSNKIIFGVSNSKIPNSVVTIGKSAFANRKGLTSIKIPSNVKTIEEEAFYSCKELNNITLENGITSIGTKAFTYTSLTNVIIPNSVTSMGDLIFESISGLTNIKVRGYTEKPNDWNENWNQKSYGSSDKYDIIWNYTGE